MTAQLDDLITTLAAPKQTLSRRQDLGRTLALSNLRRTRHILATSADAAWINTAARTDAIAEWLEQGEFLDPDDLDWPDI